MEKYIAIYFVIKQINIYFINKIGENYFQFVALLKIFYIQHTNVGEAFGLFKLIEFLLKSKFWFFNLIC